MPRNKSSIQVELHLPESPEEMQAIQRIFTEADLAYYTNGRTDRKQNDPSARPEISTFAPS